MKKNFKLIVFFILVIFQTSSIAEEKFCLEEEGYVYPLFESSKCLDANDIEISKSEFLNILEYSQELRLTKLEEFRKNPPKTEIKTEKDIKVTDVEKIKKEALEKIDRNKKKQEQLSKVAEKKRIQEQKKKERLAKIAEKKRIQEQKKKERLAKIKYEKEINQESNELIKINEELKVVYLNKKIIKNELLPNLTGDFSILEDLNKAEFKSLIKENINLVLIVPKDFEAYSNNVSQNQMSSTVVTGIRQIPNPEYKRLEMEIRDKEQKAYMAKREAEIFESNLYNQQYSGIGWLDTLSALTNTGAAIAYQDKYHNLQSQLSNLVSQYSTTPMFIDKEVFSPYTYDVVNVKAEKKSHFDILQFKNENFFHSNMILSEDKSFQVAYNIQNQDKRYNQLVKKYHTMDNVRNWENKKFDEINMNDFLNKFDNLEKTKIDSLNDVYAMLNYEKDQSKSLWNRIFGTKEKKSKKVKTASLSSSKYEIKDERFNSVVVIKTGSGMGTGFYISEDEILTNYHVIEDSMSISIIDQNRKRSSAVVLKKDLKRDLALLKTNLKGEPVKFYNGQLKQGEMVEALGHPKGRKFSLTKGWISAIRKWDSIYSATGNKDVLFIQTDAAINSGNSGGPLFYKNKVVGVNTQKMVDTDIEGMNFAVHFSEVQKFLSQ